MYKSIWLTTSVLLTWAAQRKLLSDPESYEHLKYFWNKPCHNWSHLSYNDDWATSRVLTQLINYNIIGTDQFWIIHTSLSRIAFLSHIAYARCLMSGEIRIVKTAKIMEILVGNNFHMSTDLYLSLLPFLLYPLIKCLEKVKL